MELEPVGREMKRQVGRLKRTLPSTPKSSSGSKGSRPELNLIRSELTGNVLVPEGGLCDVCSGLLRSVPGVEDYIAWRRQYDPFGEDPLCDCEKKATLAELHRWQEAKLPQGDANTFDTFRPRRGAIKALEAAQEFAAGHGPAILTLVGSVGSGKSHLAEAIARVCLASGYRVRYEHVGDMLLRFQAAIRNPDRDMAQEINLCQWWDLLVLDDLGVQVDTPWAVQTLDDIINARYSNRRRTVITTNETEAQMKRTAAVRMADRIFDHNTGKTRVVVLQCGSYRTGEYTREN